MGANQVALLDTPVSTFLQKREASSILIGYLSQSGENRHSREAGNPVQSCGDLRSSWIPAFAGMTDSWSEACI